MPQYFFDAFSCTYTLCRLPTMPTFVQFVSVQKANFAGNFPGRPITLLQHIDKVLEMILLQRLEALQLPITFTQGGFQIGRGCPDARSNSSCYLFIFLNSHQKCCLHSCLLLAAASCCGSSTRGVGAPAFRTVESPSQMSNSNLLLNSVRCFGTGIYHALQMQNSVLYFITSKKIRSLVIQCLLLNGFLFLGR